MQVFADTSVVLNEKFLFEDYEKVFISIVTIEELDDLKRDEKLGYQARQAIRKIMAANNVEIKYNNSFSGVIQFREHNNDNIILSTAYDVYTTYKDTRFLTDDYCLFLKAKMLGLPSQLFETNEDKPEIYTGYKEVVLDDYELAQHYENPTNKWDLLINQYLIIKNVQGEVIDQQRWSGDGFTSLSVKTFKSDYLDDFKPKDVYQMCAVDSLINSDLTLLFGHAGVGKTQIALSYIMQNINNGKFNKVVVIYNPVKLKNNAHLGYYSGNRLEKLMQNSIGGILASKLGAESIVNALISQGKLMIIPTSDIRGIEISDQDCLYVTEAQNTDAYTMRTIIQRAKQGCKIIVEGDMLEQQDIYGRENGMMRVIEVFKGTKYFSCVKLVNTYRSPITELAQKI